MPMRYHPLLEEHIKLCYPDNHVFSDHCRSFLELVNEQYHGAYKNNDPEKPATSIFPANASSPESADNSLVKKDFLALMSHGIRTPLNAIIGIAHLMMNDDLPLSQMENLRTLNMSAENLLTLINDILDYNQLQEGKIHLQHKTTDLRNMVNTIKLSNRTRASERGNQLKIMLDADLPRFVVTDEARLNQVLNTLLSNAIKFTRNGSVKLEVKLAGCTGNYADILFEVSDTGIGIPKDKQEQIFQYFSSAANDFTRDSSGSGLGLAITKDLLRLMNTDIQVHSEPGAGARFFFTVRMEKGAEVNYERKNLSTDSSIHKNDLAGIKVLLVEDVEFNVMVAEKMLANWNARVEVADNGLNAIGKVRDGNFDIILMDLQMPVLDGYSATKHIREFNSEIPIIALTASSCSDIEQKTKEVGMNGYVSKPFKPTDLYDKICQFTIRKKAS